MRTIRENKGDAQKTAETQYNLSVGDVFEGKPDPGTSSSDRLTSMYCKYLVALLIAGAAASGAWADPAPLLLSCHGGTKTDATVVATLCETLMAELGKRAPDRMVRRNMPSDTLPRRAWDVVLEVTLTEPYRWEGGLTWRMTGSKNTGERTAGPSVEIFGMDAPLGPGAYSHFIRDLLKVSKPAFLASPRNVNGPFQGISGSSKN